VSLTRASYTIKKKVLERLTDFFLLAALAAMIKFVTYYGIDLQVFLDFMFTVSKAAKE